MKAHLIKFLFLLLLSVLFTCLGLANGEYLSGCLSGFKFSRKLNACEPDPDFSPCSSLEFRSSKNTCMFKDKAKMCSIGAPNPVHGSNCITGNNINDLRFGFNDEYDETKLAIYCTADTNDNEVREKLKNLKIKANAFFNMFWSRQSTLGQNRNCDFSEMCLKHAIISDQNQHSTMISLPESMYTEIEKNSPPTKNKTDCARLSLTFAKRETVSTEKVCDKSVKTIGDLREENNPENLRDFDIYQNQFE